MRLMRPGSFFDGEILPMWLEGVATLFVLTRFAGHSPAFAEKYWQIYEYIGSHPEAQKIDRYTVLLAGSRLKPGFVPAA